MFKVLLTLLVTLVLVNAKFSVPVHKRNVENDFTIVKRGTENIQIAGGLSTIGIFYASVGLGTPAQTFSLILDTGSSGLFVESDGCFSGCNTSLPWFNPSQSSTYEKISCAQCTYCQTSSNSYLNSSCQYSSYYGTGDVYTIGSSAIDVITLGSDSSNGAYFGLMLNNSGMITNTDIQGIFGLAYVSLSPIMTLLTPLDAFISGTSSYNSFSLCLNDNGNFRIGDNWSEESGINWTPIQMDTQQNVYDFYRVNVNSIGVGSTTLSSNINEICAQSCIVDSGTTYINLPSSIYYNFGTLLLNCTYGTLVGTCGAQSGQTLFDGYCYQMTTSDVNAYPTLTFHLSGMSSPVTVSPSDYLIESGGYYCLYMSGVDSLGTILGATAMQGYNVIFDRTAGKVGFADLSTCNLNPATTGSATTSGTTTGSTSGGTPPSTTDGQSSTTSIAFNLTISKVLIAMLIAMIFA